ncbi:MAG: SAM-dependent methyltransferase [Pirellulales bacterium]
MKKDNKAKSKSSSKAIGIDWDWNLGGETAQHCGLTASDIAALDEAIGRHGKRCVRVHPETDTAALPFATEAVPWYPQGRFLIDSSIRPGAFLDYAVGEYYIQDAASLLPMAIADIKPGEEVCDLCASPGGKSTAALERLRGSGYVLANEVIRGRVDVLQMALARSRYDNFAVSSQSPETLAESCAELFDCVIVDAPCTGQSMVARGKQSLASYSQRQVEHSALRQLSILRSAVRLVRPGGRLIYSTCTFAHAENEAVVASMLQWLPDWQMIERPELQTWKSGAMDGCYRLWPQRDGCSGGFAVGLVRPEASTFESLDRFEATSLSSPSSSGRDDAVSHRRSGSSFHWSPGPATISWEGNPFEDWAAGDARLFVRAHELHAFHRDIPERSIDAALSGFPLGDLFGPWWVPHHAMACVDSIGGRPLKRRTIELSKSEAIRFMGGESWRGSGDAVRAVACYGGKSLGWMKHTGERLQNHLPKSLRGHYLA